MISGGLGLWIATIFVAGTKVQAFADSSFFGISLNQNWKFFILFGIVVGLLNFFVKPILDIITIPLRIITLGIFGILINMAMIGIVDAIFEELSVPWFLPLAWTTLIIWLLNGLLSNILAKED